MRGCPAGSRFGGDGEETAVALPPPPLSAEEVVVVMRRAVFGERRTTAQAQPHGDQVEKKLFWRRKTRTTHARTHVCTYVPPTPLSPVGERDQDKKEKKYDGEGLDRSAL
ncbi:hypothetical protein CEXT_252491 [Caerostris extrusa]|uniref:Uncharacterized protein n=1 Tax=Caerostris extrusa TaxID=172846 RepID=A0AAV4MYE1_CAEEX|nr:hypothetical protein CEXT_252491 [Caerostris extrusa]